MKKVVKRVLIGVIAIIAIAGGAYYMSMPLPVNSVQALPKTAELYFTEQGVAVVERSIEVYAGTTGKIELLAVEENQNVLEGDVLCVIDTSDLAFQIAQVQSNILGYQAQMENLDTEEQRTRDSLMANRNSLLGELRALEAQASAGSSGTADLIRQKEEKIRLQNIVIEQNMKDLERAKDDLVKAEILYNAGGLSEFDYLQARKLAETQESVLAQNRQQLQIIESGDIQSDEEYYTGAKESLNAQIAGIDATLQKSYTGAMKDYYGALIAGAQATLEQLNKKIADSTITAPVSGVITSLNVKNTNMVGVQLPVAVITPDITNNVEVYVSTGDIDEIFVGMEVDIILKRRGGDKLFSGAVIEIDNEAEARVSVLGVEERRVKVTVAPKTGADEIKKGFDADVKFTVYREENKLTAPKTAFFVVDDKDMVWTIKNGKAVMTEVVKGRELRTEFIVEAGLSSGDSVITDADTDGLREGANVRSE